MLSIPWDALSPLYKTLVAVSMGLSGLGIVLALIAAFVASGNRPLLYVAIGLIVVGLCVHIAGLVVRSRDARAYRMLTTQKN